MMQTHLDSAPEKRSQMPLRTRFAACLAVLLALAGTDRSVGSVPPSEEELTRAIVQHVQDRLPPADARQAQRQTDRVASFFDKVLKDFPYPTDPSALRVAAESAIDAAAGPTASANSLVRAAMTGVLKALDHGAALVPQPDPSRPSAPVPPHAGASIRESNKVVLVGLPRLDADACSAMESVDRRGSELRGVILDLRGNDGGDIPAMVCVASQLVPFAVPLFQIVTPREVHTRDSVRTPRAPIAAPTVILIDKKTDGSALALAAELRSRGRGTVVGEQTASAHDTVLSLCFTHKFEDAFLLPTGQIRSATGGDLTTGLRVDVPMPTDDDKAILDAALVQLNVVTRKQ
jgi:Peptidase family S41